MPIPMLVGNWKMHTTVDEAVALAQAIRSQLHDPPHVLTVLCPPFISLVPVAQLLQGSTIALGAQNMHYEAKGAFTGEISPAMLKDWCQFVILGHSERRHIFGESDEVVNRKVKAALAWGLRPILCVGETLPERQAGQAVAVVRQQVERALEGVADCNGLVVAYEPVWAIGTGMPATPEAAEEMMVEGVLRGLASLFGEHNAVKVPLLYGGSVTPENLEGFVRQPAIHGALVGGASLRADAFCAMVRIVERVRG
ncbi:MAG: triose-phosphate isomerase [Dehalococcoidia bacterium]|nr:triose-phosphate isomerase [Dehalococcoidia bacterium]MDW8119070.1 triose-phosphate isomerase [Chloroflexota bacterium]